MKGSVAQFVFGIITSVLAAMAAAGCGPLGGGGPLLGEWTEGERERAWFSATASAGCMFGCALDRPLAVGVHESIAVDFGAPEEVDFASSDPTVLRVLEAHPLGPDDDRDLSSWRVTVQALRVGSARLIVQRAGRTFDTVVLRVAEPASLRIADEAGKIVDEHVPFEVATDLGRSLQAVVRDASGRHLLAADVVDWSLSDDRTALFRLPPFVDLIAGLIAIGTGGTPGERPGFSEWRGSDAAHLEGRAEGTTFVTARVGSLRARALVRVLPAGSPIEGVERP
ncbi:MAG: hypothetical protein NZ898_01490 [Myxococcota bacterium]|nr:hypothetical protein [Myxococcota bacterium]MDW8362500.1 hypothetical protein [Myxococcales bacterium]